MRLYRSVAISTRSRTSKHNIHETARPKANLVNHVAWVAEYPMGARRIAVFTWPIIETTDLPTTIPSSNHVKWRWT
jgi:hypothetical protein